MAPKTKVAPEVEEQTEAVHYEDEEDMIDDFDDYDDYDDFEEGISMRKKGKKGQSGWKIKPSEKGTKNNRGSLA